MENEDVYNHRKTPPINSEPMPSLPQLRHWSEVVYECLDVQLDDWNIAGGSDYGQLPYLINSGDILLEVDGHKVSGFTRNDVLEIVRSKPLHDIKAVSSSSSFGLPIDLREYLSRRFVRGSIDQDLQATIRDNVYFRTIPCTTRPPRPSEVDGVDYKFVSKEVFMEMDKSGVLLESGVYSGHYYGTPLPLS
ncbi:Membrane-associated guanylate kinase: WW and PDZ domain-containing protein 2-like protein, partial [Leptotrombidium deliense]